MTTVSKTPQPETLCLTLNDLKVANKTTAKKETALKIEPLCNNDATKTLDDFFKSQTIAPVIVEVAARKHKSTTRPPAETGCFWPLVYTCPKSKRQTASGCHMGQVRCVKK
jgi:hypothetical protein